MRRENVIVTVYCRECAGGGRDRRRLGHVFRSADGGAAWEVFSRSGRPAPGSTPGVPGWHGGVVLTHPALTERPLPDALDAYCTVHGAGTVDTLDVVTAYRRASQTRPTNIMLTLLRNP